MNYYPFHIGDFRSGTFNMSRKARWIYRDMLDVYYDTEKPLTIDFEILCDQIGVEEEDDRRVVQRLLRLKFAKEDDGYHNATCDRVIAEYRARAETAKSNGKLGGRPRKQKTTDEKPSWLPAGSDQDAAGNPEKSVSEANQEPITNNHKPLTINTNPPNPLEGGEAVQQKKERKPRTSLKTFVDRCKQNNEKPISGYEPLLAYVQSTGLPMDYVQLAWEVFKSEFMPGGTNESRLQADWRKHFLNYIRKGYYRLWFAKPAGDGNVQYELTTQGHQARMIHKEAA